MKELLKSPAKIVFIIMAVASCVAFFIGLLGEDNFMILASGSFAFFFSYKGKDGMQEYAGK